MKKVAICFLLLCFGTAASAKESIISDLTDAWHSRAQSAPSSQVVEVAFSPNEGALELILKTIGTAKKEIRVLSYSFTSAPITDALLAAKKRGVDVAMIVDYKNNISQDASGKAKHALSALANAGVRVRTISSYPIHHDKTIIVDGQHVETGSFNYSDAAAKKNSENVIVLWNNPDLAKIYLAHWESRFSRGQDFELNY